MTTLAPPSTALPAMPASPNPPAAATRLTEQELVARLASGSLDAIHSYGRELGRHTAEHTDALLAQVKAKDMDVIGTRLTEIVVVARSLDIGALSEKRSRVPLIGGLLDKVRQKGETLAVRFQDVRGQIESLLQEVQTMQSGLGARVQALDQAFASVREEHDLLGLHIRAGEQALVQLQAELDQPAADAMQAQLQQDRRDAVAALGKRLHDMQMLQHAALQQLPMIRMVQANNRMLIEKFHTIRELTVPAWKRQFMLALSLQEQRTAVDLAHSIDNATNDFLRENARLLKDNTIATAQANQRLVIDIATLQDVHQNLMSTVQEVVRINQEGATQRQAATTQLRQLRQQLTQQLGGL